MTSCKARRCRPTVSAGKATESGHNLNPIGMGLPNVYARTEIPNDCLNGRHARREDEESAG